MGTAEGENLTPLIPMPAKNVDKKCEMCKQEPPKYTCPRCLIKTCCLSCVKTHKSQRGCSGIRDKTAYVPIKKFTEDHLLSDYRLLEDMDRKRYSAQQDVKSKPGYLNFRWKLVIKKATERGVRLRLLPHFFSKHKENSTTFLKKIKVLAWHVKWIFPLSGAEFTDIRLNEDVTLREALDKYLHPQKADPVILQRLKKYCSRGMDDVMVYMKVEDTPANTVRYHSIGLDRTLGANLKGKIVVEYPTFHVVLRENAEDYHWHDDDNESHPSSGSSGISMDLNLTKQEKDIGEKDILPGESTSHGENRTQPTNIQDQNIDDGPPEETPSHQVEDTR